MDSGFTKSQKTVIDLVNSFEAHRSAYLSNTYSEAQARKDFIDPFLKALGWDVDHERERNPYEQEVKVERSVIVRQSAKRADYAFYLKPNFRDVRFYLEAKKPSTSIDQAESNFQTLWYGWSAGTPLALLTDFAHVRVLDCRQRPSPSTALDHAWRSWHCTDWRNAEKFAEFYWLFSREAHADGSFDRRIAELPQIKGGAKQRKLFRGGYQPVDESFLLDLEEYRLSIAKALKKADSTLGPEDLTEMTQRTIDRIVFMRFLEDKQIESDLTTQRIGRSNKGSWADFRDLARRIDGQYNGIIFGRHRLLDADTLQPNDDVLDGIIENIDAANSPYNFDAIPIHILGSIYERFLGSVIEATDKRVSIVQKPEVRKAGGVYYTPESIVRYISANTVGKIIDGKTPTEISLLRFADISCGSGSFLLAIFDQLLRYHTAWYNAPKRATQAKKDGCFKTEQGHWRLSLAQRRSILLNNIFGVDIDRQAVEVAQLSLFLKLLEDEGAFSTKQYQLEFARDPTLKKILPNLSHNIVCGNSLIGWDTAASLSLSAEEEKELNPLDFASVFPKIMSEGGFDAVMGNPPYLNIDDTWGKGNFKLRAIKARYPEIYNDKTDLLFYFIVRALQLSRGAVSYIVSRAFLEAYKADKLRRHIADTSRVDEIIDFRNAIIFARVGITSCVFRLTKLAKPSIIKVYKRAIATAPSNDLVAELEDAAYFTKLDVPQKQLTADSWQLESGSARRLHEKLDDAGVPLGEILLIGQGMQTGKNNVFGERTEDEIRRWKVPVGMHFLRASNTDIQRYTIVNRGEYLLYPNAVEDFEQLPRGVREFLETHSTALKKRAAYVRGNCKWWQYTWPLHSEHYEKGRILCPYLADSNRFALDIDRAFLGLTDTTVLFDNGQPESLWYLLALLNSKVLTFRFRSIGKLKSNGIYEYFWNSLFKLRIKRIDFKSAIEREFHDKITLLSQQIIKARSDAFKSKSTAEIERLERKAVALEHSVELAVGDLYLLDTDEIKLIAASA